VFNEQGLIAAIPYFLLVALFGASMLLPILINKNTERQQLIMTGVMSIMMIWFGAIAPAGVLLYWDASSLLGVAQQVVQKKLNEHKDALVEAVEVKPVKVEVERKERKNRPKKK
jgi:YidC/Oxa1 family membrane protein insertase